MPETVRIEQAFPKIMEGEGFSLRQMAWLTEQHNPVSERIVSEIRQKDFTTLDAVMSSAVEKGMKPIDLKDVGSIVSWMIVNFPIDPSASGQMFQHKGKSLLAENAGNHEDIFQRFAIWIYGHNKEDPNGLLTPDQKIDYTKHLLLYNDRMLGYAEGDETQPATEFANKYSGEDLKRILLAKSQPVIEGLEKRGDETGLDSKLLTQRGYEAAKTQGWLSESPSYVIHRAARINRIEQIADLYALSVTQTRRI